MSGIMEAQTPLCCFFRVIPGGTGEGFFFLPDVSYPAKHNQFDFLIPQIMTRFRII